MVPVSMLEMYQFFLRGCVTITVIKTRSGMSLCLVWEKILRDVQV